MHVLGLFGQPANGIRPSIDTQVVGEKHPQCNENMRYPLDEELCGEESKADGFEQPGHVTAAPLGVKVYPATHSVKNQFFIAYVQLVRLQDFTHLHTNNAKINSQSLS
jgi:hypothetical protein